MQHVLQVVPLHPVVDFAHIQLNGHEALFPFVFSSQKMDNLIGNKDIISDLSPKYKSTLGFRYNRREKKFKPIRYNFGNHLIKYIIKTNRAIIYHTNWLFFL